MKSPEPIPAGHDDHWPIEEDTDAPAPIFRIPFDAPPLPASPTPQQLALFESNKSRLSASYSLHNSPGSQHPDHPSPKASPQHSPNVGFGEPSSSKPSSLFSRRQPDRRMPQLSLTNIHAIPGPRSAKHHRTSFTSSRDTSISLPPAFRYRRTSSVVSTGLDDGLSTPATSMSLDDIRRKMSDSDSFLGKLVKYNLHGSEMDGDHQDCVSPEIDFHINTERVIAGSRLCDVLRTLFGSNGYRFTMTG